MNRFMPACAAIHVHGPNCGPRELPCLACGQHEHSQILADAPCLECDCPAWMAIERPNPSRRST